jgi:hypothetical protein
MVFNGLYQCIHFFLEGVDLDVQQKNGEHEKQQANESD